jgi:hypothetical protein
MRSAVLSEEDRWPGFKQATCGAIEKRRVLVGVQDVDPLAVGDPG